MGRLFGFLAILLVCAIPALSHMAEFLLFLPQIKSREVRLNRLWPRIRADLDVLEKHPLFSPLSATKNAEKILASHIAWDGLNSSEAAAREAKAVNDLLAKYPYWKSVAGQAKQILSDPDGQKISTDWVESLKDYDHWDLAGRAELKAALNDADTHVGVVRLKAYSKAPMPDFADLRRWAGLHALRKKDVQALKEAARLAHSTSTLVGSMTAVAIFSDARELCQMWNKNCELPSEESVEAYKRLSWAWGTILKSSFLSPLENDRLVRAKPENGVCANAAEMTLSFASYQDLLNPRWLLESNYNESLERNRQLLSALLDTCQLSDWKRLLRPSDPNHRALSIPFLRRIYGLELLTLSIPDFPKGYDSAK